MCIALVVCRLLFSMDGFLYEIFYVTAFWKFKRDYINQLGHMGLSNHNAFEFASLSEFDPMLSLYFRIQRFITLFFLFILFRQVDFYGEETCLHKKALSFIIIL